MSTSAAPGNPDPPMTSGSGTVAVGVLLLVDLVLTAVMLVTDKNLQTNFGTQSPYYLHWYGVLVMGILDLLLGIIVLTFSSTSARKGASTSVPKRLLVGALVWTVLAIVAMLGILATYAQVGFSTPNQFAQYLFGATPYPGALYYIPWLYDLLLAMYVVTAAAGVIAIRRASTSPSPAMVP